MIRDDGVPDAKDYKSRLYHIYEHVRDDLNRDAQEHDPLPDLVINGYYLLGKDWLETEKAWVERGFNTPPVMISVANRTETAARVKFAFDHKKIRIDEPVRKLSRKEKAELLRQKVDTVGQSGKPGEPTKRSQINFCVFDSTWEASEAFELDRNPVVEAWVKNDHLGFEILYIFKGEVRKYRPDFIVRLKNGKNLILETKGQDTQQDKTKREFLDEWVRAVNLHGGFGTWMWAVSKDPADVAGILTMLKKPVHRGVSDSSDDIDRHLYGGK